MGCPRHSLASLWGGFNAVQFQNMFHGRATNRNPQILESSDNARIAPTGVFFRYPINQIGNVLTRPWTSRPPILTTIVYPILEVSRLSVRRRSPVLR
jgi:hypothetical protein